MQAEHGPGLPPGNPAHGRDPTTGLHQCPRCGGWCVDPGDERGHILDAVKTALPDGTLVGWRGGGQPLPKLLFCTPTGREVRPIPPAPVEPYQRWEWTAAGYRPVLHAVTEETR